MSIYAVPFFVPVFYEPPKTAGQAVGNMIERSLFFGGHKAVVADPNTLETEFEYASLPVWEVALKICLFVVSAGLIPLILLIAKAVYRQNHLFRCGHNTAPPLQSSTEVKAIEEAARTVLRAHPISGSDRLKFKHDKGKYLLSLNEGGGLKIQWVESTLGRGGWGKVTKLIDIHTCKITALKVAIPKKPEEGGAYSPENLREADQLLQQEVSILRKLHKDGNATAIQLPPATEIFKVIKVYGETRSKECLAHEGIVYDGVLFELCAAQLEWHEQLSLFDRLDIVLQIVQGVHFYREKKFVHFDLKPGNIFYIKKKEGPRRYEVYIGDFGGSWNHKEKSPEMLAVTLKYVNKNELKGMNSAWTGWGKTVSAKKNDIYALGIAIGEFLSIQDDESLSSFRGELLDKEVNSDLVDGFFAIFKRMIREDADSIAENLGGYGKPRIAEILAAVQAIQIPPPKQRAKVA